MTTILEQTRYEAKYRVVFDISIHSIQFLAGMRPAFSICQICQAVMYIYVTRVDVAALSMKYHGCIYNNMSF